MISLFIKIILFVFVLSWSNASNAVSILGTGAGALQGGDLTDPENDGVDGAHTNWNWSSISASSEPRWTGEGSYNVFDNKVGSSGNKWCCNGPTQWIAVEFAQAYVLTSFTITSGNDVPSRDPDVWKIQGSNDGNNWTDIFTYNNDGSSPWSARNQVLLYSGGGDDYPTPSAYLHFRYRVTSTGGGNHQINELEFFGTVDSTDPTLTSSSPADNDTAVSSTADIVLNFDEAVNTGSGNVTIKKTSDDSVIEAIDVTSGQVTGSGSAQITVNPSVTLDSSTEYYVLIGTDAFDDLSGNSYAGISSTTALSFTVADTINPTLTSSVPAHTATGVAGSANIVLNFNESVNVGSGNITIKKTSDDSVAEAIDVTTGQVSGSGSAQITVNPSVTLSSSTEYYVLIDANAFDDISGNSYAGISSKTAYTFTIADTTDPTLTSSVPTDDATDVSVDTNIVLNFSESVNAVNGNVTIKKTSDDSVAEAIDVTTGQLSGSGTAQITLDPSVSLQSGIEYYVLIDPAAFDDLSGNSYAGISSTTALSFTTASKSDPTNDKDVVGLIEGQADQVKNVLTQSLGLISSRLDYLRQNKGDTDLSNNDLKIEFADDMLTTIGNALKTPISDLNIISIEPDEWTTWSKGSIRVSKIGDTSNSSEKEIDSQGIAFGIDKKINENDIFGFSIQYGQSDTDVGSNGSGIDGKNYSIAWYRTKPIDNDNFIEGTIGIGKIKTDIERKSGSNTLTASRNGDQIFSSINFGKNISKGDYDFNPVLRVDLGYTELDEYSEEGTDALSYDDQEIQNGLLSLGLGFNNLIKFDNSKLKPIGLVEVGLDFSDSSTTKLNYVSDTSTVYTYTHDNTSDYMLTSEIGFLYESNDNLIINTSYKRIQGERDQHSDTFIFGLNFEPNKRTVYALQISEVENLSAGLNILKKVNDFDINLNIDQQISNNREKNTEILVNRKF